MVVAWKWLWLAAARTVETRALPFCVVLACLCFVVIACCRCLLRLMGLKEGQQPTRGGSDLVVRPPWQGPIIPPLRSDG